MGETPWRKTRVRDAAGDVKCHWSLSEPDIHCVVLATKGEAMFSNEASCTGGWCPSFVIISVA